MQSTRLLVRFCAPIAALALALALALTAAVAPQEATAAAPGGAPVTPACAWGVHILRAHPDLYGPDSAQGYWLIPFTVQKGLRITLSGHYPDARYTSIEVYNSNGSLFSVNGVNSALTDYLIAPDPGSANPWQVHPPPGSGRHHRHRWGGDRFTVTLRSDVSPGQPNTLPLAPSGTTSGAGFIIYRVLLPARRDFARVPVPDVTFTLNGVSVPVPRCQGPSQRISNRYPFVNADSAYLFWIVTPPANDQVMVIRAKAASFARGSHPSPWPVPGTDLQYWSLCDLPIVPESPLVLNHLPGGRVDYGCRDDSQTALDRHGYYTYVVGTEAQRAAIDHIPGATFVPFSTAYPTTQHVLIMRNVVANPAFPHAIQDVPYNASPATAAKIMGPYYPHTAICSLSSLLSGGLHACLAGANPVQLHLPAFS